jgi:hypothetical protein
MPYDSSAPAALASGDTINAYLIDGAVPYQGGTCYQGSLVFSVP